jgi:cell division protein FtsI (penicillin-binding protein 3)
MRTTARGRALFACGLLAVCFTGFSWRLVHVQVRQHADYAAVATAKHTARIPIPARRGTITDAQGEPLAQNEPIRTVIADASLITDPEAVVEILAGPLALAPDDLRALLSRTAWSEAQQRELPAQYIVLKKRVPEIVATDLAARLGARKLRGIRFDLETTRIYPNARLACHILGFAASDETGVGGVEQSFNSTLSGQDGFRMIARDGTGRELPQYRGFEREPRHGHNLRLTLDMGLQNIVENEIDAACKLYRPKGATVILMEPFTGAVLALANRPHFDLNDLNRGKPDERRNRAVVEGYEPGSTFKIVTAAAALDRRIVSPQTMIFCENGYFQAYSLRDHAAYRYLSVNDIIKHSSNIGVAKLAIQMGDKNFYEYVRRFGFGDTTGIALPAEERGTVHPPHTWDKLTETRMAMGHAVQVTPIQVASAMSVIANGGKLMMPQIVREVTDEHGAIVSTFPPQEVRPVCRESAARSVRDALIDVCTPKGTGDKARVFGHLVAGKTGTAEKPDGKGGYLRDKYIVSFAGFMPAKDPAFVAVVVIDDARTAHGRNYGGLVAAPIFSRIAEKAARYLGIAATETRMQGESGAVFAREGRGINTQ